MVETVDTTSCKKKWFSIKKEALRFCEFSVLLCLALIFFKTDIAQYVSGVALVLAGGIVGVIGANAVTDYSKSKYYQEGLARES